MLNPTPNCSAIETALAIFGRAWAAGILDALLSGATRFSEIRSFVAGATDTMISRRLKELCEANLVERVVQPGPPTVITYRLTPAGRDTRPVVEALRVFGQRHAV